MHWQTVAWYNIIQTWMIDADFWGSSMVAIIRTTYGKHHLWWFLQLSAILFLYRFRREYLAFLCSCCHILDPFKPDFFQIGSRCAVQSKVAPRNPSELLKHVCRFDCCWAPCLHVAELPLLSLSTQKCFFFKSTSVPRLTYENCP